MQVSCPQCTQRISIDDAKVPERPFSVKCPKCQTVVKLPGRAPGGAAPEPPAAEAPPPAASAPAPSSSSAADEARAQMMAPVRMSVPALVTSKGRPRAPISSATRRQKGHWRISDPQEHR